MGRGGSRKVVEPTKWLHKDLVCTKTCWWCCIVLHWAVNAMGSVHAVGCSCCTRTNTRLLRFSTRWVLGAAQTRPGDLRYSVASFVFCFVIFLLCVFFFLLLSRQSSSDLRIAIFLSRGHSAMRCSLGDFLRFEQTVSWIRNHPVIAKEGPSRGLWVAHARLLCCSPTENWRCRLYAISFVQMKDLIPKHIIKIFFVIFFCCAGPSLIRPQGEDVCGPCQPMAAYGGLWPFHRAMNRKGCSWRCISYWSKTTAMATACTPCAVYAARTHCFPAK